MLAFKIFASAAVAIWFAGGAIGSTYAADDDSASNAANISFNDLCERIRAAQADKSWKDPTWRAEAIDPWLRDALTELKVSLQKNRK